MSKDYSIVSPAKAAAYNAKAAWTIGWGHALPLIDVQLGHRLFDIVWAGRESGLGSERFADLVAEFQSEENLDVDGWLGQETWSRHLTYCNRGDFGQHVLVAGMAVPLPDEGALGRILMQQGIGLPGKFLPSFYQGSRKKRILGLHWGGYNAESCFNALYNQSLSTHFIVPKKLDDEGQLLIYQVVDLMHTAYHGGPTVNGHSIGIDIGRSPQTKWVGKYTDPKVVRNPMSPRRGDKEVIDLDPEYGRLVGEFVNWLACLFEIPTRQPYPGDALLDVKGLGINKGGDYRGVLGHHHWSAKKWDVGPWAHRLPCWTGVEETR